MAKHPYAALPQYTRWSKSVAGLDYTQIDPVVSFRFRIEPSDKVATAGSCFAQHIARHLSAAGFNYFVPEQAHEVLTMVPGLPEHHGYGLYSARYGNVYTSRQLLQLYKRAFGTLVPQEKPWLGPDGGWLDPCRPTVQPGGFATRDELERDRAYHLACVARMFQELDIFVFTLGLTEMWHCKSDGMALPVAPGVAGGVYDEDRYGFTNLSVDDVVANFSEFVELLQAVNPTARIILTVSPVPLAATAKMQHVLVSTTLSKSILRVAADILDTKFGHVSYFPSYEIITANAMRGRYYSENLRDVTEEGVSHVMRLFMTHVAGSTPAAVAAQTEPAPGHSVAAMQKVVSVACDEALIETAYSQPNVA